MRHLAAALIPVLICAMPAFGAELPSRKPGLWEIKMNAENRAAGPTIRQCIDASTDQMMQQSAGALAQSVCSKRDVQRTATGITIDSICTMAGKTVTTHAVVAGNFDSAYTMTVTPQGEALPAGTRTMTMSARWLGPCAADQKPGDMIMANGMKMNILDMQRRGGQPSPSGMPGAPGMPVPAPPR